SHRPAHTRRRSGYLRSQRGNRTAGFGMVAVLQRQMPTDELFPAFTTRNSLQGDYLFPAKVGKPLLDGFDEQVVFAAEMLVKAPNRQPRCLHQASDGRSAQPLRPESTGSALHDPEMGPLLMVRFITHNIHVDYIYNLKIHHYFGIHV